MSFHQQLFKEKGWRSSAIHAKVCVVSVVRSDYSHDKVYCKKFYSGLVNNLDNLEFQRGQGSTDMDEVQARLLLHRPDTKEHSKIVADIRDGRRPLVFYCEDSPLNRLATYDFAKELCKLIECASYAIINYDNFLDTCELEIYKHGKLMNSFIMSMKRKQLNIKEKKQDEPAN